MERLNCYTDLTSLHRSYSKSNKSIYCPVTVSETAGLVANRVDSDQTKRIETSDMSVHCLLRRLCLNTSGKCGI